MSDPAGFTNELPRSAKNLSLNKPQQVGHHEVTPKKKYVPLAFLAGIFQPGKDEESSSSKYSVNVSESCRNHQYIIFIIIVSRTLY